MKILRAASAGWSEVQNFVPKIWGLVRQLFNEVMGVVFLAVALFFAFGAQGLIHTYRQLDENPESLTKLLLLAGIVFMLSYFGVSSFRRARKVAREG